MATGLMTLLSDEQFEQIVNTSKTYREIVFKCGYNNCSGGSERIIKERIARQGLHFESERPVGKFTPSELIFINDSSIDRTTLRKRYKAEGYSEYKCAICGLPSIWNDKELVLTLDHINGNNRDNRIENLRWVCPNCDRQLDTFAGRNIKNKNKNNEDKPKNYCVDCGAEILIGSTRCRECSDKHRGLLARQVERPSREELKFMIRNESFVAIGKKYILTDNAIRKWCDEYNLPRRKKDITKYSDEEWEKL